MPSSILNSDDGVISGTSGLKSSGGDDGVLVFQSKGTETARINTDSQIVAAAGTASLPALTTTGDVNTGIYFPAADTIAFAEGGAEAMRIDSSGRVGIGTTSPASRLTVAEATQPVMTFTRTGTNEGNGVIESIGNTGTVNSRIVFGAGGDNAMIFSTGSTITERMRIDSSGNLLIATTSTNETTSVGVRLINTGVIRSTRSESTSTASTLDVYSTGASAYRFYVDMAGTVFATNTTISAISDQRYKENIRDLDVGLDAVMQLRPRKFDWKEGKGQDTKDCRGFIAQEFEQVFPDLIDTWKDPAPEGEEPYKSVRQDLIPVLVKALQELSAKNDALEARIAALEAVPGNE